MKRSASESNMKKPRTTSLNPKPCPAAVFISGNDDLLTLILLRLPLKSMAKFKSVSRHWLRLITTTPRFSLPRPLKALFFKGFPTDTLLLLDGTAPPVKTTLIPAKATYRHSCNGLYLSYRKIYTYVHQFYVSNPTTKLYEPLPRRYPDARSRFSVAAAYLAFDPYVTSHYKVVLFFHTSRTFIYGVMIYSSETRHWRLSSAPFPFQNLQTYEHGVFWNGAIYWASFERNTDRYRPKDKQQVYRFHVFGEERMERVTLPSSDHVIYLGLCGDHLHLALSVRGLNMYEMDKESDRWHHVHSLRHLVRDVRAKFGFVKVVPTGAWWVALGLGSCRVVFFDKEETCLYLVVGERVVRYDIKARTVVEIYEQKQFDYFTPSPQHMEVIYKVG